jgi:hypothetical protein
MRILTHISVLAIVVLVSACGSIPQKELAAYTAAFDEAKSAGVAIVHDFAAAAAETKRRQAAKSPATARKPAPAIPTTYVPPSSGEAPLTATEVRLLAWEAINGYNKALAALNAGESVEKVKSGADRLFTVIFKLAGASGSAVPGTGALVDIAKVLAAELEKARLKAEFKKAIRSGTPTIRKMFTVFREDTKSHYQLRAALARIDYERVSIEPGLSPREKQAKRAAIKAKIDEFRKSLDGFNQLLTQADNSLLALQKAADKPIDFSNATNRILDTALVLKRHWFAYQNARNEASK